MGVRAANRIEFPWKGTTKREVCVKQSEFAKAECRVGAEKKLGGVMISSYVYSSEVYTDFDWGGKVSRWS